MISTFPELKDKRYFARPKFVTGCSGTHTLALSNSYLSRRQSHGPELGEWGNTENPADAPKAHLQKDEK